MNHHAKVLLPSAPARRRSWFAGDALWRRLRTTLRLWARRREGRRELRELDEPLLRDLGISRGQADFEGSKPFWRC
ncbi:MAG: DUF1127 domain-containing protein [Rhodocyclaceae bacterium]|nr:DUF1127 domain-containing protein [Rhodocyclaceae bacterium]